MTIECGVVVESKKGVRPFHILEYELVSLLLLLASVHTMHIRTTSVCILCIASMHTLVGIIETETCPY